MIPNRKYIFCLVAIGLMAFTTISKRLFSVPKHFPKPVYDFSKNPLSTSSITLGRALFYDPILSRNNTISCASCHSPYAAFTHVDHNLSHGIDDRIGTRNSPALMNLAWQNSFMWDGAINHLDMQALAPISHPDEMGSKIDSVIIRLQKSTLYPTLFYNAYGDSSVTGERTLKSIAQFMLSIVSANAKYDRVKQGKEKFTAQEANGYRLFQKNCNSCHKEPLFTNYQFENNGLPIDPKLNDLGRMKISHSSEDSLKFKVPTLRNIEYSYPYMHDGRFKTLSEVLRHYTQGTVQSKTLSPLLQQGIILNSNEKVDLTAFLLTLSDKEFLFKAEYAYPKHIFFPQAKE